jgi:hypothetical protein
MQLSDLRTTLRGWLQDTQTVQWTSIQLNRYLNFAIREVQKNILAVDPEAFKCVYKAGLRAAVTGEDQLYTYPAGTWGVIELAISSDGTNYTPLSRITLPTARGYTNSYGFITWDKRHFMLYPASERAISSGLRIIVIPTLVMAEDTDEMPLPNAFEMLLLKWGHKLALMDVGEPTDKLDAEIQDLQQGTARYYFTSSEPTFMVPNGYDGGSI